MISSVQTATSTTEINSKPLATAEGTYPRGTRLLDQGTELLDITNLALANLGLHVRVWIQPDGPERWSLRAEVGPVSATAWMLS